MQNVRLNATLIESICQFVYFSSQHTKNGIPSIFHLVLNASNHSIVLIARCEISMNWELYLVKIKKNKKMDAPNTDTPKTGPRDIFQFAALFSILQPPTDCAHTDIQPIRSLSTIHYPILPRFFLIFNFQYPILDTFYFRSFFFIYIFKIIK